MEPQKHPEMRWFGKDEVPSNLYGASKPAIDAWVASDTIRKLNGVSAGIV